MAHGGFPPWAARLAILVLAIGPALGILAHEFVFDSLLIIQDNATVQSLTTPWQLFTQQYWPPPYIGGLYRPISILLFSIEWVVGDGGPMVFHAVSIGLYAWLCLAVYRLAHLVLPPLAAWAGAALFAVHPVHTESVAVAVNQSELLVALLLTVATSRYIATRQTGSLGAKQALGIVALYTLACLVKEHALILPGLLLAAEATVVISDEPWRIRWRSLRPFYLASAMVGLMVILVRGMVLQGDVIGSFAADALVGHSMAGRLLTMLSVVPEWARLLFWPAHLQIRYSPQEIVAATGWGLAQTIGALILGLAIWGTIRLRNRWPAASFGLLWMGVALFPVHNVLVPTGIVLAERTLLLASVGAVILAGVALAWLAERGAEASTAYRLFPAVVLTLMVGLGIGKTVTRYPVWRNQFTLFQQTTIDAALSYEAHFGYADLLAQRGRVQEAETEYLIAIQLFPEMEDGTMLARRTARVLQNLGNLYLATGLCEPAIETYDAALAKSASIEYNDIRRSLIACLLYEGNYHRAAAEARIGIAGGWDDANFRRFLVTADSALRVGAPPHEVRVELE
jgi:hypothetical protein